MSLYVLLRRRRSFTSRKLYVCLEILCFLQLFEKSFHQEIVDYPSHFPRLTTNFCRFSICFLHDRQQNGNVKRSEFVEFDGRKSNKCSRYLLQELSDLNITESSHSICRPSQRLYCKECKFLPDHEYSSPRGNKTQNYVNLCLFCRLRQHYKVETYIISMEFSAVNRRRPSRETPLGPGAKKDGCFRRLEHLHKFVIT